VTFSLTPLCERRLTRSYAGRRFVFVTGILTLTFLPHVAISSAWRSSLELVQKTSNEIGRSGMARGLVSRRLDIGDAGLAHQRGFVVNPLM
jgi:hypothetical protein